MAIQRWIFEKKERKKQIGRRAPPLHPLTAAIYVLYIHGIRVRPFQLQAAWFAGGIFFSAMIWLPIRIRICAVSQASKQSCLFPRPIRTAAAGMRCDGQEPFYWNERIRAANGAAA